ncbi:MAG: N-acetylmuramoyl-L-alanine amidase [Rickettsiales bacterium]|nr:N-acetylmuramoyl-L-alanine amidase [Rickettsiales bacterium]
MKNIIYFLFFGLLFIQPALAAPLVDIAQNKGQERIIIATQRAKPNKVFQLDNPYRLVVDVPTLNGKIKADLPEDYKGKLIKTVRAGQNSPTVTRFVFELEQQVKVAGVAESKKPYPSLAIILEPKGTDTANLDDTDEPKGDLLPKKVIIEKKEEKPKKAKNKNTKPLIVIDPGHGGIDPGAIGPDGTQEKHITLDFSKVLKEYLLKTGRYRVILTRENDRFIMLRKRVEVARKAKADLFISIHADSALDDEARGLSVYTLSEKASDQEAAALAARENKADILAGVNLTTESQDVADILISLAQRETNNRSATVAITFVDNLENKIKLLPNSHRFAGFAVLKAPDIPSILIETGFISHPKEEQLLKTRAYKEKVASGLVAGIDEFFRQERQNRTDP